MSNNTDSDKQAKADKLKIQDKKKHILEVVKLLDKFSYNINIMLKLLIAQKVIYKDIILSKLPDHLRVRIHKELTARNKKSR